MDGPAQYGDVNSDLRGSSLVNGVRVRVPGSFAGILPVSPSEEDMVFEIHTFIGLRHALNPGDVALDIGCSYGIMSTLMGKMVGASGGGGRCHSFEANPDVIRMARLLLAENGLERTVTVHNLAVSDRSGEVRFNIAPGYKSVSSSINPEIRKMVDGVTARNVRAVTIDEFCLAGGITPGCIKIDIEGSECVAVRGMRRIIDGAHPDLVIETHGLEIDGIGGDLPELTQTLESAGYRLMDMVSGEIVSARRYASDNGNRLGVLMASTRLSDSAVAGPIQRDIRAAKA